MPTTLTEYMMWVGVQFPVVAVAAVIVRWSFRAYERLADDRRADNARSHAALLAEKDARIADRDARIRQLERQLANYRARRRRRKDGEQP